MDIDLQFGTIDIQHDLQKILDFLKKSLRNSTFRTFAFAKEPLLTVIL